MVVTKACPGLVVEVCVDNVPLPEYEDKFVLPSQKSISKWIEGEADKKFVVKFRFTEPLSKDFYGIAPPLGVDGIFLSTPPGSFLTTDTIYKPSGFQLAPRDVPKESENSDTPRPSMIFKDVGPGEH